MHEIIKFKQGNGSGAAQDGQNPSDRASERRTSKIMGADPTGGQSSSKVPEPKDKLGENLISKEEYETLSKKFRKPNGEEMQPHEVPGYFTRKVRYGVNTVNDFIMKVRRTAVCDKFFQ